MKSKFVTFTLSFSSRTPTVSPLSGVAGHEQVPLLYQDSGGSMYSTATDGSSGRRYVPGTRPPPYLGGGALDPSATGGVASSSGTKLLQAASAAGSRANVTAASGNNWLAHPTGTGVSGTLVSDLIGDSPAGPSLQQIPVAVGAGAPVGGSGGAQGGNLVMDVDGKVYYVNQRVSL